MMLYIFTSAQGRGLSMGIQFIFFLFGLSVSAKEEDLQGYPSMQNESTTTTPTEEQNRSAHDDGKASTESPAHLTSPGTDFLSVHVLTTNDTDAITQTVANFVSTYGTDSLILSKDSTAEKQLQSKGDLLLISNDEGGVHPSAEAEFESMMNDTMTPSAHLSTGREKISAFLHASLKSKNQTVLDSITFSPANGIPMVSASDPAVIDNLWESNKSMKSQGKNRNENWILELFRTGSHQKRTKPIQADKAFLNKTQSAIIHFTVSQNTAMKASDLKNDQYQKKEKKEQENLHSQSSAILNMPLQVKSTSRVSVDQMTESSRNPSANRPKLNGPDGKHTDLMFLFSTSKLTPRKTTDSITLNYSSNVVTAAGETHVTKQFVSSQLISDSLPEVVSARNALESKLIFHTESSKKHHNKQTPSIQTSTTISLHSLNKSNVQAHNKIFSTAQNSSSSDGHLFQAPVSIQARTSNMSMIKIRNRIGYSPVLLSKLIAASFTSADEASTAGDARTPIKHSQRSFTAPSTLTPQNTSELSTESLNAFHVSKVNNHSPIRQSPTHFPPETLRLFASNPPDGRPSRDTRKLSERPSTQSSFTSVNVKRFRNNQNFTELYSTNQNRKSRKVSSLISDRPNINKNVKIFTRHETVNTTTSFFTLFFSVPLTPQTPNSNVSTASITFARTPETLIIPLSLEQQESAVDRLLSTHAVSQKKTSLISTSFSKSRNIVTTDGTVLSKHSGISAKSNSKNISLDHSSQTENISLPLGDRQQGPKNPKGTEMLLFTRYTVSSIPSVRQLVEHHSREISLTATQQLQSKVEIESYLKKRDGTVKPTTLQHIDHSCCSVVGMNHTSLKSILDKIVSQNVIPINSTPISPVVYSTSEFIHRLAFLASPETLASAKQVMTQPSVSQFNVKPVVSSGKNNHKDSYMSHQVLVNLTDVQEYPQKTPSRHISAITESLKKHKMNTTTSSPTFFQVQTVLHRKHMNLPENQTKFFTTVNKHSQMTQPNIPPYETSSSETTATEDLKTPVTVAKSSHIYSLDVGSSSTQMLSNGSLQSSGGSVDVSHGVTPYAHNTTEESNEFVSDMPVMNRKKMIISPDSLIGSPQISDDICGTGNYTAEMSLNLEGDIMLGDLIPALGNLRVVINLQTNNSHVDLEIKSCCLSPTVRLDEFNTTCCTFSKLAVDPHGTRLLPSVPSKRAAFTIRLFQMINYSTAYLHCDLSVCLRNHSECERGCVEQRNARPVKEAGAVFSNRISFGPVLKGLDNSSFFEAAADRDAGVVIMSSAVGCLLACLTLLLVWMAHRRCLERSACCRSGALCEC